MNSHTLAGGGGVTKKSQARQHRRTEVASADEKRPRHTREVTGRRALSLNCQLMKW